NVGSVFGSSYSAPQITGLAALLHQKYKQQFGVVPAAALIKSVLLNTARDLGNIGPDYTFGYGKPDAYRAVKSIAENMYFSGDVSQQQFKTHPLTVAPNATQLKITLSWTDKEGSPIADLALVNNLDVKLVNPAGDTILPWKLNPSNPKQLALRGIDNLNTNEQITIENPIAGNYTVVVKGTAVPFGPQSYAVAYYVQERKIEITHPNGGELIDPGTSVIKWFPNGVDSTAKIEFSSNNGSTWQTLVSNQQLSAKTYSWPVPNIVSDSCLVRISSGNNIAISASTFKVGTQIFYPSINHSVCDRSVKINWPAVTDASGYKVYLFEDTAWTFAGQTSLLTYTINKLKNGKTYFYAISTIKNGFEGNRSLAKSFIPTANACATPNDVGVYAVNKPFGGRQLTSAALTNAEKISLIIKNYGTVTQSSISVSYTINGGPVRTGTLPGALISNDTAIIQYNVNENLAAPGNYSLKAWTNFAGDNNFNNDTLYYTIKHLSNPAIALPSSESFESLNTELTYSTFGLSGLEYADYYTEEGGRLRSNEGNLYAKTGNRAISLDNYVGTGAKKNELIFTRNLSNYVDSIVFLEFNYMSRAEPDSNDIIFARGDDTKPWVRVFDLFANKGTPAIYKNVNSINLYQKLKIENGQNFSTSTQIKILHTGTKTGITPANDGGYSFDDFKLFNGGRDVSLLSASVKKVNCTSSFTPQPITIKVKNNSSQPVSNLNVFYKVDGNPVVSEVIPTTIPINDSLQYTFSSLFNYSATGLYSISCWVNNPGDKNNTNDTVLTSVVVMQTIDSFPYYNDLETNNGAILTEGVNNSWVWATPLKYNMSNAAQENKAWTTGVNKGYNFFENSYLYMGCLDFSSLTTDPLISFNFISIMQTQSDSAFAEYSTDGIEWKRLGCYGCGLNWYNGYLNKALWDRPVFPWQVAHLAVPLNALPDPSNFMYRIRLMSDGFVISEGIGIDDIRIFNDYQQIATTDSAYVAEVSTGNGWIQFYRNGRLLAELNDDSKNLGNILVGYEANSDKQKTFNNKNIFPRNWVFKPKNPQIGNYKMRLYVLNSEYTEFVLNEDSISRMGDIELLRYVGLNTNLDVFDNHVKSFYKTFSPAEIQFYPYQNGYYIEFETDTLGEFYLVSLKQDATAIQNINLLDFSAQKINDDVLLDWKITREINSKEFVIQYSFDAAVFIDVDTVPAG
ncbi:MAG TPA: S8 family serine peptidase, partial [Chitinophagales bacterium]|nr:S8 family serine peptidase [Chitinophagales bacterium]